MFKKILISLFIAFNLFFVWYLLSPTPTIKDLVNSSRSTEPGDTVQLKNVSAYYTNLSRTEVMNFYKSSYSSPFRIILNHPPEKSKTIIRDTTQSYYLEEIVIPFKESLFVNGFEWQNDVFTKPEKRIQNKLIFNGKEYSSKVTLKLFPTSIASRLLSLFSLEIGIFLIYLSYCQFFKQKI